MCFLPVQNGQEMRIFLFIHRNRPVEVVQSSWITALTQQTDPCGGTKRFLKCTFQGGLPLHQLHLGCEAGTEFSQLQWRLIFDPFPFHCISWALNHCCAEQFHSASQLEFHPLKKVVLYLDLDLLLSILHFSLGYFFTTNRNFIGQNAWAGHLLQFSLVQVTKIFHFHLWPLELFTELTCHLNDCFQNTYFLHPILMQAMSKSLRLISKTRSVSHNSYIIFIRFITMQEWMVSSKIQTVQGRYRPVIPETNPNIESFLSGFVNILFYYPS